MRYMSSVGQIKVQRNILNADAACMRCRQLYRQAFLSKRRSRRKEVFKIIESLNHGCMIIWKMQIIDHVM